MSNNQKGFSTLLIVAIVAAVVLAGAGSYVYVIQMAKPKPAPVVQQITKQNQNTAPAQSPAQPTPPAQTVTPPGADDTSTWQTYRNEEWGIEFKYPAQYKVEFVDNNIIIKTADPASCIKDAQSRNVSVYPCHEIANSYNFFIDRYLSQKTPRDYVNEKITAGSLNKNFNPVEIKLGDINAIEAEGSGMAGAYENIFFRNGNYIFETYVAKEGNGKGVAELKQIISTFKLIEAQK